MCHILSSFWYNDSDMDYMSIDMLVSSFLPCHVASNFNKKIESKNLKAMVMWVGMENQLRKYQTTKDKIIQLSADGEN